MVCIFYSSEKCEPCLYILFLVDKSIDVNNEQVLRIIENLLLNESEFKDFY